MYSTITSSEQIHGLLVRCRFAGSKVSPNAPTCLCNLILTPNKKQLTHLPNSFMEVSDSPAKDLMFWLT